MSNQRGSEGRLDPEDRETMIEALDEAIERAKRNTAGRLGIKPRTTHFR